MSDRITNETFEAVRCEIYLKDPVAMRALDEIQTAYQAALDTTQTDAGLVKALEPFANYACDLLEGETCDCHNCRAREALSQHREGKQGNHPCDLCLSEPSARCMNCAQIKG